MRWMLSVVLTVCVLGALLTSSSIAEAAAPEGGGLSVFAQSEETVDGADDGLDETGVTPAATAEPGNQERSDDGVGAADGPVSPWEERPQDDVNAVAGRFCAAGKFYSIERSRNGGLFRLPEATISEISYDTQTGVVQARATDTPSFSLTKINGVNTPGVNSLGLSDDGVFYFTVQDSDTNLSRRNYDVYRYTPGGGGITAQGNLERVVANGSSAPDEAFVAGAVDPVSGDYFFGHYRNTSGAAGRVTLHVYRHEAGSRTASKIGIFRTPAGVNNQQDGGNGDFAFDAAGNLIFVSSGGSTSRSGTMVGTITAQQLRDAAAAPSTQTYDIARGAIRAGLPLDGGTAFNGIAYTAQGDLIVQQGSSSRLKDSVTLENLTGSATAISGKTGLTDIATCVSPPTIEVTKNVVDRVEQSDQFRLVAQWHATESGTPELLGDTETTGTANGVQKDFIGPIPVRSGTWFTISEEGARGADLAEYSTTFACSLGGKSVPVARISDNSFRVQHPRTADAQGAALSCQFTNEPAVPALEVTKSADPASGTAIAENETVTYSVSLDNTTGTAPAKVEYTDNLADVLDDAKWLSGPEITGPAGVTVKAVDFTPKDGAVTGGSPRLEFTGAVPARSTVTVTYAVQVLSNSSPRVETNASSRDYVLHNAVTGEGTVPPGECASGSALCTEHPIKAWTVSKSSVPAPDARVSEREVIFYSLSVDKLSDGYELTDIVLTDDLTDVMRAARWAPNRSVSEAAGARAWGIYFFDADGALISSTTRPNPEGNPPKPEWTAPGSADFAPIEAAVAPPVFDRDAGTWTLRTAPFDMPKDVASAEVWFAVEAGVIPNDEGWNPQAATAGRVPHGTVFTNRVSAAGADNPVRCVTGDAASTDSACEVSHTYDDLSFDVRKFSSESATDGTENIVLNGHEFELRADEAGQMGAAEPGNACVNSGSAASDPNDPTGCWRFFPSADPSKWGTWEAKNLPPGTYWLLETKAATHQRDGDEPAEAAAGIQLLAEPIKFRVGGDDLGNELDVFVPGDTSGAVLDRCVPGGGAQRVTACVDAGGFVLRVVDPKLVGLPMTGAIGMLGAGALGLAALAALLFLLYHLTGRSHRAPDRAIIRHHTRKGTS